MSTSTDYPVSVVIVNRTEPEGEVAGRLIHLAKELDYDVRTVQASRGDHDAALSFRVPKEVADAFEADRAERFSAKIENDDETASGQAGLNEDAYAADGARVAKENAAADGTTDDDQTTTPARTTRTGKAKE